ncbi:MAG: DNA alkylation repair protein [Pseudomonadales bacterium]|nr:DNA alkylation repair protein [Pseudomonadales bacterium]
MSEILKDRYDRPYVERLAKAIGVQQPTFPQAGFVTSVLDQSWSNRELKDRMKHIRGCIQAALDLPYEQSLAILKPASQGFGGFEGMLFPDFVEAYGLNNWDASMVALAHFTQSSSAEFAVRPFILQAPELMMQQMLEWSEHSSEHVRRLATEGCRPRLPWAQALPLFKQDPALIMPILDNLHNDTSLYVRRSVANNLNDIAKDNPAIVIDWVSRFKGQNKETDWLIRHGCRTLLKQAHPEALKLFGFAAPDHIEVALVEVQGLHSSDVVSIGDNLYFSIKLSCPESFGLLRVEYAIDYMKANGKQARKIFKLAEGDWHQTEKTLQRKHSFRQMSTRKHYPGQHNLAIIINGEEKLRHPFEVLT